MTIEAMIQQTANNSKYRYAIEDKCQPRSTPDGENWVKEIVKSTIVDLFQADKISWHKYRVHFYMQCYWDGRPSILYHCKSLTTRKTLSWNVTMLPNQTFKSCSLYRPTVLSLKLSDILMQIYCLYCSTNNIQRVIMAFCVHLLMYADVRCISRISPDVRY